MHDPEKSLILTAASPVYADSLLGLIGSLNCNWPDHPPVLVYDLGLDNVTRAELDASNIAVRTVPPFCPHWRRHFTWKIWACHDAPTRAYLWLDAAICVLNPFPEVLTQILRTGYFAVPNGLIVGDHMTPGLQRNMGVTDSDLCRMPSLSGGIHGFDKNGKGGELLREALSLALVEENLMATAPRQFHEQTLLSILLHRYFAPVFWADRFVYGADQGGILSTDQRVWCHRRAMQPDDLNYFRACLRESRPPHRPTPPPAPRSPSPLMRLRIRIARMRGRCPLREPDAYTYDGVRD